MTIEILCKTNYPTFFVKATNINIRRGEFGQHDLVRYPMKILRLRFTFTHENSHNFICSNKING
jgi:hypothetical protein